MKKEKSINFEINFPTSWEDITLKQYQDIEALYEENENASMLDILGVISDKTAKELKTLPFDVFEEAIMPKMSFLYEKPKEQEPTNKIVIKGETYFVNFMEKMKTGEFLDSQTVLQKDRHNYAMLLAILCRKKDEIYDDDFIANVLPDRVKMFEKQPITEILPIVAFFLQLWTQLNLPSLLTSKIQEIIDLTLQDIENSKKTGLGKALSTLWLTRKLRKLKKQCNRISQRS